jgi:hypothetical protein
MTPVTSDGTIRFTTVNDGRTGIPGVDSLLNLLIRLFGNVGIGALPLQSADYGARSNQLFHFCLLNTIAFVFSILKGSIRTTTSTGTSPGPHLRLGTALFFPTPESRPSPIRSGLPPGAQSVLSSYSLLFPFRNKDKKKPPERRAISKMMTNLL